MDTSLISAQTWETFQSRYPEAYNFLLRDSVRNEFTHLRIMVADGLANNWELSRFEELKAIFND